MGMYALLFVYYYFIPRIVFAFPIYPLIVCRTQFLFIAIGSRFWMNKFISYSHIKRNKGESEFQRILSFALKLCMFGFWIIILQLIWKKYHWIYQKPPRHLVCIWLILKILWYFHLRHNGWAKSSHFGSI